MLTTSWEPYRANHRFMRFGNESSTDLTMESDFLVDRMAFWAELVGNYSRKVDETRVPKNHGEPSKGSAGKKSLTGVVLFLCIVLLWF